MKNNLYNISVGVVIINSKSEIFLIESPLRGWEYPGGQVNINETLEEAAVREVFEETGFHVKIKKYCGVVQNINQKVCSFLFIGEINSGERFVPNDEALNGEFFPIEIALKKVKWLNFSNRISICLNPDLHPFIISFGKEDLRKSC